MSSAACRASRWPWPRPLFFPVMHWHFCNRFPMHLPDRRQGGGRTAALGVSTRRPACHPDCTGQRRGGDHDGSHRPWSSSRGARVERDPPLPAVLCVYGWLRVRDQRCRIKVLLDSGTSHCSVSPCVALRWQQACGPLGAANPKSVSQADCSCWETHFSFTASLVLGGLDEETSFTVCNIGCCVDALLGY